MISTTGNQKGQLKHLSHLSSHTTWSLIQIKQEATKIKSQKIETKSWAVIKRKELNTALALAKQKGPEKTDSAMCFKGTVLVLDTKYLKINSPRPHSDVNASLYT